MTGLVQRSQTDSLWKGHVDAHKAALSVMETEPYRNLYHDMLSDWVTALKENRTIYFVGNGGSSVDACHIAAELSGRYERERPPLRAHSLTANLAHITAVGNDYGYEYVFERMCRAVLAEGDILVAITTSGNSENILRACQVAKDRKTIVHGWTGETGGKLNGVCDKILRVPSKKTSVIQECYMAFAHALCGGVEECLSQVRS
jgi:D-sedoheptulose 7-phosphate isomerase